MSNNAEKPKIWLRRAVLALGALVIAAGAAFAFYFDEIRRLRAVMGLFEPANIVENFQSTTEIFDYTTVRAGDDVWELARGEASLPETFAFGDETMNVQEFLDYTQTLGLIVIHDDAIVFEEYYRGSTESTRHISWSVSKSFTSALLGIAVAEGRIEDVTDPVTKYAPMLAESGYNNVPIKHVLQMSSGIRFNEDYGDFNSDINRMGRMMALNSPIDDFVLSLENEREPGTLNHYVSMDTQVLAMVLREATGQTLTSNLEEKVWRPAGMEADAYWLVDVNRMELAFGCLNAVLRDYARFGLLYLHHGRRGDEQIVPEAWIEASLTPDGSHLQPGDDVTSTEDFGYGYQWWIPPKPEGDFLAIGVYNQFIYVHPAHNVVIAKNSANIHYVEEDYISEPQHVELFRAIARHVDQAAG